MNSNIQRCPHDEENPYAQISNELIRDKSLSPNARWLAIYLLSNKDNWQISVQQIITHLDPHMKRKKVYAIIDELIEAGYMKREQEKDGKHFKRVTYYISERPKFKKCLPRPLLREAQIEEALEGTQRTTIPKEQPSIKKQQPDAALADPLRSAGAGLSGKEKKRTETPLKSIYPCLECVDIPLSAKTQLTADYDEITVSQAIDWALNEKEYKKGFCATLRYGCKEGKKIEEEPKKMTVYEELCKSFKNYEYYNNAECILKPDVVAFSRGMKNEHIKLDKFFSWEKFQNMCISFGIPFQRGKHKQ